MAEMLPFIPSGALGLFEGLGFINRAYSETQNPKPRLRGLRR